jgi:hypothetical protein
MAKDNISMNKELLRWKRESENKIKKSEINKEKPKKPSGKCQICGKREAEAVCLKCGKSVCKSCYFKIIGICKKCVPPEIAGKWDGSKPDWEKELGVEWVD